MTLAEPVFLLQPWSTAMSQTKKNTMAATAKTFRTIQRLLTWIDSPQNRRLRHDVAHAAVCCWDLLSSSGFNVAPCLLLRASV